MEEKKYKKLKYLISYPEKFNNTGQYPLWIHLHGSGGRGNDVTLLKTSRPIREMEKRRKLPFIVIAPQCYADTWFEIMEQLLEFIQASIRSKNIDRSRVYLSGVSMGGYACWSVVMSRPEWFAAAMPICGGGMYWNASRLKDVPIWAFHGRLDRTVFVCESEHMVDAINKAGGNARLTIYDNLAHDSWTRTFANDEIYEEHTPFRMGTSYSLIFLINRQKSTANRLRS